MDPRLKLSLLIFPPIVAIATLIVGFVADEL
jgi:hypothetical protein